MYRRAFLSALCVPFGVALCAVTTALGPAGAKLRRTERWDEKTKRWVAVRFKDLRAGDCFRVDDLRGEMVAEGSPRVGDSGVMEIDAEFERKQ